MFEHVFKAQVYLNETAWDQTFPLQGIGSTENFGLHESGFLLHCLVCHLYGAGVRKKEKMAGRFTHGSCWCSDSSSSESRESSESDREERQGVRVRRVDD